MLENKEETKKLGNNGRKYTEEVLGWDKIIKNIYS